jgi:hypothetical protein
VANAQGLNVLCITEHIDAVYFMDLYEGLFIENKLGGKILDDGIIKFPNSVTIGSGTEIPLNGGGEVGIQAKLSTILSLNRCNSHYKIEELSELLSNNSYIMIGNHLYVPGKWIEHIEDKLCMLDAIEMLPKEIIRKDNYVSLAVKLGKPLLSGSDSHVWSQLGLGYNEVDISEYNISSFKEALKHGKVTMKLSSEAEKMSEVSTIYRSFLMEAMAS